MPLFSRSAHITFLVIVSLHLLEANSAKSIVTNCRANGMLRLAAIKRDVVVLQKHDVFGHLDGLLLPNISDSQSRN